MTDARRRLSEATGAARRGLTRTCRRTAAIARRAGEEGFTLVELLVAMAIIAILVAVGVSQLLGLRNNAHQSAAKQELEKVRTAEEIYINTGPGSNDNTYGSLAQLAGDPVDYTPSSAVTSVTVTATGDSYTAIATGKDGKKFEITATNSAPTEIP
jgi:type IV pilus assembly protein PilA